MPVIGKDEFLKLSKSNKIKAMKTGAFVLPREGTADREEINKSIYSDPVSNPPPKEPEVKPEPPKVDVNPKPTENNAPPETPVTENAEPQNGIGGYKSTEDLLKAHEEQKSLLVKQQQIIDKINATNGNQGRKLSSLEKELEEVRKKIVEQNPAQEVDVTIPDRPDPSDSNKYPDGILDPKYQSDFGVYTSKLEEVAKSTYKTNKELLQKVDRFEGEFSEFKRNAQTDRAEKIRSKQQEEWDTLSSTLSEFQQENGIRMSVPWVQINNNLLMMKNEQASPEDRKSAQAFINTLSPVDIENFKKLTPVVTTYADFSEGTPKPRFQNMKSRAFRGYLEDAGIVFTPPPARTNPATPPQPSPGVSPLPASTSGSSEPKLSDMQTGHERIDRLRVLEDMRRNNNAKFKADPSLVKEYGDLRASFMAAPGK